MTTVYTNVLTNNLGMASEKGWKEAINTSTKVCVLNDSIFNPGEEEVKEKKLDDSYGWKSKEDYMKMFIMLKAKFGGKS
jgi:hypothetical protein